MFSFITKVFFVLLVAVLLIIVTPNPIRNRFPQWLKEYENYNDPRSNHVLDLDQLEIMNTDPLKCYKNADCTLELCGTTPNCHSLAINQEYLETHLDKLPYKFECPKEAELGPDDCGQKTQYDLFSACIDGQCVKQRLLPTPTPSQTSIIDKALYQK